MSRSRRRKRAAGRLRRYLAACHRRGRRLRRWRGRIHAALRRTVTRPFDAVADVRQLGELLIFEDCLIVKGSAISLSRGDAVVGPVDRAVVVDPSGRAVASSGVLIFVDGSTIEGDGGIPCDPKRGIATAVIAGAIETCTPVECGDGS